MDFQRVRTSLSNRGAGGQPSPTPSARALQRREEARRTLSPKEADPTQALNRKAKVLIKSGTTNRIEDIEGPRKTLQELAKQLTIIAEALTTARAQPRNRRPNSDRKRSRPQ